MWLSFAQVLFVQKISHYVVKWVSQHTGAPFRHSEVLIRHSIFGTSVAVRTYTYTRTLPQRKNGYPVLIRKGIIS